MHICYGCLTERGESVSESLSGCSSMRERAMKSAFVEGGYICHFGGHLGVIE